MICIIYVFIWNYKIRLLLLENNITTESVNMEKLLKV